MLHSLIQFIYKLLALSVEYLILIGQLHHPVVCYSQKSAVLYICSL